MPDSDAPPEAPPNATLTDDEQAELDLRSAAPEPEPPASEEPGTDWEAQYQEQSHSIARMQVVLAHYAPEGLDLAQESKFVIDGQYRPPAPTEAQQRESASANAVSAVQRALEPNLSDNGGRRRVVGI